MSYLVIDADGKEIKSYKTLAGAEKAVKGIEGASVVDESAIVPVEEKALAEPEKTGGEAEEKTTPWKVLVRINIRKGPSLDAVKLGAADEGMVLEAYEDLGDWLRIRWKGGEAFARHKNHEYVVPVSIFAEKPFTADNNRRGTE